MRQDASDLTYREKEILDTIARKYNQYRESYHLADPEEEELLIALKAKMAVLRQLEEKFKFMFRNS